MNYNNLFRSLREAMHHRPTAGMFMVMLIMLAAAGCTDDADNDNRLPDGKYPITFTAAVDGLGVSRATTDADGKTSWVENDPVAISKDGGTSHKEYKITDASTGAMSPNNSGGVDNTLYWSKIEETLAAWHPATWTIGSGIGEVSITNQSSDFETLENILYAPSASYTYSSSGSVAFTFRHALAKVKVTLKEEDGKNDFTDTEISDASVTFMGYTAGSLGYGGMTGSGDNGEITSKKGTPSGGTTTYTALLIPQQMLQNQPFIKVTVGTNDAARDYYYKPTNNTDANLEAGKEYTYTITVKKEGLQVTVGTSVSWDDNEENGNATNATFKIHLADFSSSVPTNTSNYTVTDANNNTLSASDGVYSTTGNKINISLSANDGYRLKKFLTKVTSGICKQKVSYTSSSRTYTYIFYDIRSDLWLDDIQAEAEAATSLSSPNVGDYYYADGTWSSSTLEKPCIGIVFKAGAAGNDNTSNYDSKLSTIHGYVVALHDALATAGNWGTRGIETTLTNVDNENETAYTGYSDTKTIISSYSNGNTWKDYQAFSAVVDYRSIVPAPDASSDWYLPSLAQLGDVYSALNSISIPLTTAGQGFTTSTSTDYGWYWTSSEKTNSGYDAWHVSFRDNGKKANNAKDGTNYDSGKRACYARAILTF